MKRTPKQIGDELEEIVEAQTGGRRVRQSGGGRFYKLDATDAGDFVYSCKATDGSGIRITGSLWRETVIGARGPQGHGDDAKPALVTRVDGEVLVTLRFSDHLIMATGEVEPYIAPTAASARRQKANSNPAAR
jgi:hypothetical protein